MAIRTAIGAPEPVLKRVLVVDDNRSTVRLIQQALERESVDVSVAYDGSEALEVLWMEEFPC